MHKICLFQKYHTNTPVQFSEWKESIGNVQTLCVFYVMFFLMSHEETRPWIAGGSVEDNLSILSGSPASSLGLVDSAGVNLSYPNTHPDDI